MSFHKKETGSGCVLEKYRHLNVFKPLVDIFLCNAQLILALVIMLDEFDLVHRYHGTYFHDINLKLKKKPCADSFSAVYPYWIKNQAVLDI